MDTTRMLNPAEGYEPEVSDGDEEGQNPLVTLHMLLKGRYWLAAVTALVLAILGAMIGYKVTVPKYTCTGTIHILPVISSPLLDKNGTMPMYDSFVLTQMEYLKS